MSASLPDSTFFHEVFNPFCEPVPVGELDAALTEADVRFLGHIEAPVSAQLLQPAARTRAADAHDGQDGAYHYALFGKAAGAPDMTRPGIVWSTVLRPAGGGRTVQIAHAASHTVLDRLAQQHTPLVQIMPVMERELTLRVFRDLWANRLVTPLKA